MTEPTEFLDLEDLIDLARSLLGDPPPIRDAGLLAAAAERPRAIAFGEDAYPDLWHKAAALLHSIVTNRSLTDGNAQLGWLAAAVMLELNDASVAGCPDDEVCDLVELVASDDLVIADIATRLRSMHQPVQRLGHRGGRPRERPARPARGHQLERPARARVRSEHQITDAVRAARERGISWQRIGQLLGTSGEAAQQRYGPDLDTP